MKRVWDAHRAVLKLHAKRERYLRIAINRGDVDAVRWMIDVRDATQGVWPVQFDVSHRHGGLLERIAWSGYTDARRYEMLILLLTNILRCCPESQEVQRQLIDETTNALGQARRAATFYFRVDVLQWLSMFSRRGTFAWKRDVACEYVATGRLSLPSLQLLYRWIGTFPLATWRNLFGRTVGGSGSASNIPILRWALSCCPLSGYVRSFMPLDIHALHYFRTRRPGPPQRHALGSLQLDHRPFLGYDAGAFCTLKGHPKYGYFKGHPRLMLAPRIALALFRAWRSFPVAQAFTAKQWHRHFFFSQQ